MSNKSQQLRLQVDDFVLAPMPSGADKVILLFTCPKCSGRKEIDDFGLRCLANEGEQGADLYIRQSWCRDCRSGS
jgi:hypothetical protein